MQKFGAKLRELRIAKRMSQAEIGDILGVTRAAVQQWERDATVPTLANLNELARFFGVSFAELMGAPSDEDSVDAELRQLPDDMATLLRDSFLTTIRTMKATKKP